MADANAEFLQTQLGTDPNSEFLRQYAPSPVAPNVRQAKDIGDAIIAGLHNSATGLAIRGKLPSQQLGEDAPWYHRLAAGAAGVVADLPLSIVGAVGGGAAGSTVGPLGTAAGGGAGAFAVPMALRDALIEAYSNHHALSWQGAWEIAKAGLAGGGKGAVIGGLTGGAGGVVTKAALGAGATARVAGAAATGAELATLTGTAAALDGKLPTWQDFMDNAILLGGMKAATRVASNLRETYAQTGKRPEEVAADAAKNPELKTALAEGAGLPPQYKVLALEERIQAAIGADPRPEIVREAFNEGGKPLGESARLVDWSYVTDSETAQGVLREISAHYGPEIEAQRRGVVTNADSVKDAKALLETVGPHQIGAAGNSGEILLRAALLRDALDHTRSELEKIAGIPEIELTPAAKLSALAAIERVAMLNAEFAGVRAEAGRALQIFRAIKRDPNLLGEAQQLITMAERKGSLQDIAALAMSMKDPAQLARFAQDYVKATPMQKMLEFWKAGILTGPMTHEANMLGNLGKWTVDIPESIVSATLFAIDKAAHGDPLTIAQWKARALQPLLGVQKGAMDALRAAAEVWRGQGEHVEKGDLYRGAIEGKFGEIVRLPFKALQVEDVLFRTMSERGEAYKQAVDRAVKEGLHPDTKEWTEAVTQYTNNPEFGLSDAQAKAVVAKIQQVGAESVFTQRLGPFMETMQFAIAKHAPALGFIVPFVRTPVNLVSWAIQHTPGLNFISGRWREDFAAGGERRAQATARVVIGTGIAITAYSLAHQGLLTGGGLFDKEEGGTKRAAGWQPYSLKVGDTYYSFQRLEPVAKALGIAADLVELTQSSKLDEDKAKAISMLVLMFGNATVSTTYLSGLSNAMQAVLDPDRKGTSWLEQYATSAVPKIVGQTVTMADPHKREIDGVLDAIQSQMPFLREKLLPKRDVWGEPTKNDRWFEVMPIATTEQSHDKVRTEAMRLHLAIEDAPRYLMEKGPFNPKDKRVKLEPEQRDIFREVSGKKAMEYLAPIVNAEDWRQIPDFAKAEIYKKIIEGARVQGQLAALPPDEATRVKLRQQIVDKILKQTEQAGQPAPERRP